MDNKENSKEHIRFVLRIFFGTFFLYSGFSLVYGWPQTSLVLFIIGLLGVIIMRK